MARCGGRSPDRLLDGLPAGDADEPESVAGARETIARLGPPERLPADGTA
ncbi:hypothetical protein [Actinoplanes siamensis]|uniref:Uncharacterized protein n=1 Tax=Actinoplanes siamensis TaxID=1223317 RepID=A0A919N1Z0_9ACTN|nr:hypothetical protein [Actinoplanes siamensis]GIF02711.1 hypothetical protein Asi03nite_02490 [Actinoplanes siamensis]